jgi:hypothetical protein
VTTAAADVDITPRDRFVALTRFHWAAGARVALRANAMVLGTVVFVFGSAPEALTTLRNFLLGIVGVNSRSGPPMVIAAFGAAIAWTAVRRDMLCANGWMRALPIGGRAAWRAGVAALCMAQIAVATFIPLCVLMAVVAYRRPVEWARVASLFLMIPAVAATVLPSRRIHTRVIAAIALAFAIIGTWGASLGCIALLSLADALSPAIGSVRRANVSRSAMPRRSSATAIWIRASWRAMRLEGIAAAAVLPIILGSYAHFIARNNSGIERSTVETVTRVAGALAVAAFTATLANTLLRTRQPWPWARSLPWSCARRVMIDAIVLGAPMVIVPLGLWHVSAFSALVVACLLPLGAASGASALRLAMRRQTGAAGETTLVMLTAGAAIVISPWFALVALGATPFVLLLGAHRERDEVATRWSELHHDAAGDPVWLGRA